MTDAETHATPPPVFISYAQFDPAHSDRVLALAHALAGDGLDLELDQFHGHETTDWPRWCEERLRPENTDFVLMVCTAEYRRRIEGRVAFDMGRGVFWEGSLIYGYLYRGKANGRFIPVLLDDEPDEALPPAVANWTWFRVKAFGIASGDPGYEGLYRLITRQPATPKPAPGKLVVLPPRPLPAPDAPKAAPKPRSKPCNLPYPSLGTLFKGREDTLAAIHAGFAGGPGRPQALVPRHAIHGLGGIGKTRAAVEYAWRHADDYSALLFVSVRSPTDLGAKLAGLCDLLGLAGGVTEEPERTRAALAWLADPAQAGWLLIADNLDTVETAQAVAYTLAGLTGGHLLITGRLSDWPGGIQALRLDVLAPGPAREFLLERTADKRRPAPDDAHQAAALAEDLGYLALALEQAAAFIRRFALTLAEYRRRWLAADQRVRHWHDPRTMQYDRPLATTWQATVDDLPAQAKSLLDLLAWLSPEPLPRFLFDQAAAPAGCGHLFEGSADPRAILRALSGDPQADPEEALAQLRDFSLLQPATEADFDSVGQVHRVPALITRERLEGQARTAALKAALDLMDTGAVGHTQDVQTWPAWGPLEPHCRALVDHAEAAGIAEPTARLLNDLGLLLNTKARHGEAESLMRRALSIDTANYGSEHPIVALRLSNVALVLYDTNRLAEAEPLMRQALAIEEASYGPEHPNIATRLNNLAALLLATNRPTEAEPLLRQALDITVTTYGPAHPMVAMSINNLGSLLWATNRLAEAEPLLHRALMIAEASNGHNHPDVAFLLQNLARLLLDSKRLAEAEPLIHRALGIDEASYGPEHPRVAHGIDNLARLLQATNRPAEAEPLMRRALGILLGLTRDTGHTYPNLRKCLDNYRVLLDALSIPEAEQQQRIAALAAEAGISGPDLARLLPPGPEAPAS